MTNIPRMVVLLATLFAACPALAQTEGDDAATTAFRNGAFAEALTGWMRAAATGDGRAARHVGVLYDTGEGVAQDQAAALRWYERAAALGDVPAMFNVAVCFDAGRGTVRDPVTAAAWYRNAAAHRFGRAEYDLALMQEQGDGVPRDRRAAAVMFGAALQDGIEAARLHLPSLASRRHGTVTATEKLLGTTGPNVPRPRVPAPAQADGAFASAQAALLGRSSGAASQAAALFARAAAEQDGAAGSMARYDLAWCYQNGIGVVADQQRAYRIFVRVAAETDDPLLGRLARAAAERASGAASESPVTVSNTIRPATPEK